MIALIIAVAVLIVAFVIMAWDFGKITVVTADGWMDECMIVGGIHSDYKCAELFGVANEPCYDMIWIEEKQEKNND